MPLEALTSGDILATLGPLLFFVALMLIAFGWDHWMCNKKGL